MEKTTYLFRGDNNYTGGPIGRPLGSLADISTPWEHVRKESCQTSLFTSFTIRRRNAEKFAKSSQIIKVSVSDLNILQQQGLLKIYDLEEVVSLMQNHPQKRVQRDAKNVQQILRKNGEILIEGQLPASIISPCE